MANIKIIEMKAQKVAEVQEKLQKAQSVVVFDYRGLSVSEATELRREMRKQGVEYVVLKNAIVQRAAKELDLGDQFLSYLIGPSAFAFGVEDAVAPAKILKDSIKKYKKCEIKGGLINGVVSDAAGINTLADLPSRDVLIARLLGSLLSPISGLAIALDQVAKKSGEGDAAQA